MKRERERERGRERERVIDKRSEIYIYICREREGGRFAGQAKRDRARE